MNYRDIKPSHAFKQVNQSAVLKRKLQKCHKMKIHSLLTGNFSLLLDFRFFHVDLMVLIFFAGIKPVATP